MRLILGGLGVFIVGAMFLTNGALLIFRPDLFLRFYDWQNPGDYVGKTAAWRKDVRSIEWKFLGVIFALMGVFLLVASISLLLQRPSRNQLSDGNRRATSVLNQSSNPHGFFHKRWQADPA
jgi:hypothetical protein